MKYIIFAFKQRHFHQLFPQQFILISHHQSVLSYIPSIKSQQFLFFIRKDRIQYLYSLIKSLILQLKYQRQMQNPISKTQISSPQLPQINLTSIHTQDKLIRQKWNYVFHYRKGRVPNVNPEQQKPFFRHKSEPNQIPMYKFNMNAHKIQAIRTDLLRQNISIRKKKNDDIFYRKKSCDFKPDLKKHKKSNIHQSCQMKHKNMLNLFNKDKLSSLPYMLRPRKQYIEKQMNIIDQQYYSTLLRIKSKQDLKASINQEQKMKMITKMKGSKVYYQLMKQIHLPHIKTSDHEN